jgi:hypothetical protein
MGTIVSELFVWDLEFGFWNLFVIWFLVLGIYMIFIKQAKYVISVIYLLK